MAIERRVVELASCWLSAQQADSHFEFALEIVLRRYLALFYFDYIKARYPGQEAGYDREYVNLARPHDIGLSGCEHRGDCLCIAGIRESRPKI
jgi:hypothetical protein